MQRFPLGAEPSDDIDTKATALLAEAPVVRAVLPDGADVWLALSHGAVRQVLSDQRFSREAATAPGAPTQLRAAADPDVLPSMDPPKHARVRRLVAKAFSPRMVHRLAPRVTDIVRDLLDGVQAHGSPADLVDLFTEPLPIMVICELMGVPYADRVRIRAWSDRLLSATGYPPEEIMDAIRQIREYLGELVEARRRAPSDDLTTALIRARDEGDALTEVELVANLQLLLIAGHETTVNQLGNSIVALFRHPDQLALLRDHPDRIGPAIDELLRYARLLSSTLLRVTVADVDLAGTPVGAGEPVIAVSGAANQDPSVFTDPGRLDLTRPNAALHLSFGHGTHFCLGSHLARMELRIALTALLERFPKLAPVDGSALVWKEGTPVRALRSLPVTW